MSLSALKKHIMSLLALKNNKLFETECKTINKVQYIIFSSISSLFVSKKLLIVRIFTQIPPFSIKIKYINWNFGEALKYDYKTWKTNFDTSAPLSGSFPPFFLQKVADSKDFDSNTSYQDPQNKV